MEKFTELSEADLGGVAGGNDEGVAAAVNVLSTYLAGVSAKSGGLRPVAQKSQ